MVIGTEEEVTRVNGASRVGGKLLSLWGSNGSGRAAGEHALRAHVRPVTYDALYQDASHEVVFADRELERAAVNGWLRRFHDQRLSLADAVSFEVMRTRRIRHALALDGHFALAGYELAP